MQQAGSGWLAGSGRLALAGWLASSGRLAGWPTAAQQVIKDLIRERRDARDATLPDHWVQGVKFMTCKIQ